MAVEKTITLSATGLNALGNAREGAVSTFVIQIVGSSWVGSVAVKARVTDSAATPVAVAYTNRVAGTVATAAITADALIEVNASACDIFLDYTHTSGSATVFARPVIG